ncbi:hypothetical protein FJT64_009370 [Amphibalanus amphitrite]|uniref:Uncharacterized protein n=1 Tax=Amphibalanus amphitrite TaxID=1232801 RepID=A0A6A4VDR9_AMPAM|nr:hypothetical protein FJT64_009370 [Amphibalanus amphitrite]
MVLSGADEFNSNILSPHRYQYPPRYNSRPQYLEHRQRYPEVHPYRRPYPYHGQEYEDKGYGPHHTGHGRPGRGGFIRPWTVPKVIQEALKDGLRPSW